MFSPMRSHGPVLLITATVAAVALSSAAWPVVEHLGPLATALLLGLLIRIGRTPPERWQDGIGVVAKRLLRAGIVLLGVRLNLLLVLEAGLPILGISLSVIVVGLIGISWLGRRLGVDPMLAMLIAVGSSICGGSAVVAAAPVLRAKQHDVALVVPMCSLLGTIVMLGYTVWQHLHPLSNLHYGMLVGSTLHEVAQVVAAVTPFEQTVEIGMVAKLTRVVFLAPVLGVLGWVWTRRHARNSAGETDTPAVPKPWFVLGFLAVSVANTLLLQFFPAMHGQIARVDGVIIQVAVFLMAMAMVAMGWQTDFAHLRANGLRALATAVLGWMGIASLVMLEIWMFA